MKDDSECCTSKLISDGAASLRGSANDYCSLNHDPLWLRSEIKFVRSAVKPNSAETCPIEAQRDDALTSYLIVGTGALNATHIEQRHIRHKTANRQTIRGLVADVTLL